MSIAMRRGIVRRAWKRLTKAGIMKGNHNTQINHKRYGERPSALEASPASIVLLSFVFFNCLFRRRTQGCVASIFFRGRPQGYVPTILLSRATARVRPYYIRKISCQTRLYPRPADLIDFTLTSKNDAQRTLSIGGCQLS